MIIIVIVLRGYHTFFFFFFWLKLEKCLKNKFKNLKKSNLYLQTNNFSYIYNIKIIKIIMA